MTLLHLTRSRLSALRSASSLLCVALLSACAQEDVPVNYEDLPVRDTPNFNVTPPTPDQSPDPVVDMGPANEEMGPVDEEMGEEDAGSEEMTPDLAPDYGFCSGPPECALGETRCRGQMVVTCMSDVDGCLGFGPLESCPSNGVCIDDTCQVPPQCVDNDNDGYGANCSRGPDCDDNDRNVHPGVAEVCDGKDNDCNNLVDDNISGVGQSCSAGQGACMAQGTTSCNATTHQLTCSATPSQGSVEVCDSIDNDCDGQVDEGGVCPTPPCGDDDQEPNDTLTTGYALALDTPKWGLTCSGDEDFFDLPPLTANQKYRVYLAFDSSYGELQLAFYKNNDTTPFFTSTRTGDHDNVSLTAAANTTYRVKVLNVSQQPNLYRINVVSQWNCDSDDAYERNDSISTASYMPVGWDTPAYMCGGDDDWYFLGEVASGKTISVDTYFSTGFFSGSGDLDLDLFADPDGDNTYSIVKSAATSGDDEFLTHTTTHQGYYFLRVSSYYSDANDYEISVDITP